MRAQAFIDFEGTEDCRLEKVPSMDMKRRTLCQSAQIGDMHMSSPVCCSRLIACTPACG